MFATARVLAGILTAGLALTALGACSSAHHPDPTAVEPPVAQAAALPSPVPTTVPTTSSAAPASAAANGSAPAGRQIPLEPSPLPSLSAVPAAPAGFTEACTSAALLTYVRTQQGPETGFGEVKINNCVGGYARLYAKANPDSSGARPEGDQFFLKYTGGHWVTLARGAAIDCGDNLPPVIEACAVFEAAAPH